MERILELIADEMASLNIDYHYLVNKSNVVAYPYITSEYNENDYSYEDGATSAEMILTAFTRGELLDLIELQKRIKEHFKDYRKTLDELCVHISYKGNYPRATGDSELNKIEIYLDIHYWEGANQ